jgi:glycosyltransferase involved in cell wall biosynthesis
MANPHPAISAEAVAELPFVTVIMPIRNEAAYIAQSLGAVVAQTYPSDRLEIIISDGLSTDGTREIIQALATPNLYLLDNPQKIVATGLNAAIHRAKGDIIVRVDGHTIIEPDYVYQCVTALKQSDAGNVGGPMRAIGKSLMAEAIALATSSPFGIGNSAFHYSNQEQFVDTVYMGAFPKQLLFEVGLYNEKFVRHQDYELNYRIRERNKKILLTPKIRSHYYVRSSLPDLWRQYWQYGLWKGQFLRQHPGSWQFRHLVPPGFVGVGVVSMVSGVVLPGGRLLLAAVLLMYGLFLLTAVVHLSLKKSSLRYVFILPLSLSCLHISWGLGVWHGFLMGSSGLGEKPIS